MSFSGRLALGLCRAAAVLSPPATLDAAAARLAIRLIGWYQRRLSRHSGRICLFHPSCSHRAAALLAEHGWRVGMPLVRDQVERCSGEYTLVVGRDGSPVMTTRDGRRFEGDEIAPYFRARR